MPTRELKESPQTAAEGDARAIEHLKQAIARGRHWYLALLEAIKLWKSPQEDYKGRHYRYLIAGEAFDWLLLAERLIEEIDQSVPEKEKINLLFFDQPPLELSREEFKALIGPAKYKAYLNYLYGVLAEEALIAAVVDEIRKERRVLGINKEDDIVDKAYRRIYGEAQQPLLDSFRKEKKYPRRKSITLSESKEFTYWLFQYRIKKSERSRLASDIKKALAKIQRDSAAKRKASRL
ncbi:MAG TPA: hypothetical protein EYP71_00460 [Dehalococcoidia bacterium]|nr:hypothetical protein [Dehalococcoidia bacterium]